MAEIVLLIIMAVLMLLIFLFLYDRGYMVHKTMSAVTFLGSSKGNGASFSSCSGSMKRVIRFREDSTYTFTLDAELSQGSISVELHDSAKRKIMKLNPANRNASVAVEKRKKYFLVITFIAATGKYTLICE